MTDDGAQAAVAARVPGAATLGLVAPPGAAVVPAALLADPAWPFVPDTRRLLRLWPQPLLP